MSFQFRKAHSNPRFYRHKIIMPSDKILMKNCLFIRKSIQFNLPSVFNHWFTFQFPIIGSLFLLAHITMKHLVLQKVC